MTADWYPAGEDGQDRLLVLEAIDRDLERLGELTRAYVTDAADDLSLAVARIPDEDRRHDAEDILDRLRFVIAADFDEPGLGDPAVEPSRDQNQAETETKPGSRTKPGAEPSPGPELA